MKSHYLLLIKKKKTIIPTSAEASLEVDPVRGVFDSFSTDTAGLILGLVWKYFF